MAFTRQWICSTTHHCWRSLWSASIRTRHTYKQHGYTYKQHGHTKNNVALIESCHIIRLARQCQHWQRVTEMTLTNKRWWTGRPSRKVRRQTMRSHHWRHHAWSRDVTSGIHTILSTQHNTTLCHLSNNYCYHSQTKTPSCQLHTEEIFHKHYTWAWVSSE